jgi:SAM-dependent methyltransferase
VKIQLGCGFNFLEGWANFDTDVDLSQPLPWADGTIDFIFAEHVIEHLTTPQGVQMLAECYRVLKPGGVVRIAFPDVRRLETLSEEDMARYLKCLPTIKTRSQAILLALTGWGHQSAWTTQVAEAILRAVGFWTTYEEEYGLSSYAELTGIEAHHRAVGDAAALETSIVEGWKAKRT